MFTELLLSGHRVNKSSEHWSDHDFACSKNSYCLEGVNTTQGSGNKTERTHLSVVDFVTETSCQGFAQTGRPWGYNKVS